MDELISLNLKRIIQTFAQDSSRNVVHCWWNNAKMNCEGQFDNLLFDNGPCFTLYPNRESARERLVSGNVHRGRDISQPLVLINVFMTIS